MIAALDQRRTTYDGDERLLATFTARTGLSPVDARTLLAKFNLGAEHVDRPCATLSPGERTRAEFAELMARGVNLLVLDETNRPTWKRSRSSRPRSRRTTAPLSCVSHDRRFSRPSRQQGHSASSYTRLRSWPSPRKKPPRPVATSGARSTASTRRASTSARPAISPSARITSARPARRTRAARSSRSAPRLPRALARIAVDAMGGDRAPG